MTVLESLVIFCSLIAFSHSTDRRYDRYSGYETNSAIYTGGNNTYTNCTIAVRQCTPHEGRRVDGTCNNFHYPTRGSARGPYLRLLNPDYSNDKLDIRKDRDGADLPSARRVRTTLQTDGRVVDKHDFTIAAYHFLEFIHLDVSLLNGPLDYLVNRQYCCKPEGQLDPRCKPILVPNDDPYLRVTDIRCLNFSRAETFQDDGCINATYTPEQINFQTPVIDLSTIYGVDENGLNSVRVYKHGLLKLEYRDFRHVPLANLTNNSTDFSSFLSLFNPAVLANLTMLSQQMLNLTMSNSSMWGNITLQNRQNMLLNFAMLNASMLSNSSMWQNPALNNKQMLGNMFNLQNMQGVLSMLQNLTMVNPKMLRNLTTLNPEMLGNLSTINQQMLGNLAMLNPQMLANLIRLNPQMLGNLATMGNVPSTKRRRRQVSLPTTGGINDAILTPVMSETDQLTPLLMEYINMTYLNRSICLQNRNNETRCYVFGLTVAGNFDLRTTTFAIFFMREHNRLARALHKLNPCWKDDRLFKVARQINIATETNILMYELLPSILGYKNMLKYGLISEHVQHVTAYDEDAVPLVYAEFEIAVRSFHTMLDGRINFCKSRAKVSGTLCTYRNSVQTVPETSALEYCRMCGEEDETVEHLMCECHALARQRMNYFGSGYPQPKEFKISEKFYGDLQRAADLPSLDIQRGRDLGIRGYNDYRHICGIKPARKFEDFADVMDNEKIEALKRLYVRIEDIDLLAGIMSEKFIAHTFVGPTLFCIMTKQLQLYRFADRFWFERGDQFHSLTLPQLREVRKTNIARFACDNADAIKFIQPRAFENVGPQNQHMPCTHIPGLDITKWKDNSCNNDKYHHRSQSHENDHEGFDENTRFFNRDSKQEDNYEEQHGIKNKEEYKMHWSINKSRNHEGETIWPMPRDIKAKVGNAWATTENESEYKKGAKNDHMIHWSMNLDTENNNKEHNNENVHREDKQREEMALLVSKPGPDMHWSINKYAKQEGAVYGPFKKENDFEFWQLKDWSMGKHREPMNYDDGKYKGENYRQTIHDHGETGSLIKNNEKHISMRHNLNGPIFPSTSHQTYQSDTTDFAPYFQSFLPVT